MKHYGGIKKYEQNIIISKCNNICKKYPNYIAHQHRIKKYRKSPKYEISYDLLEIYKCINNKYIKLESKI